MNVLKKTTRQKSGEGEKFKLGILGILCNFGIKGIFFEKNQWEL